MEEFIEQEFSFAEIAEILGFDSLNEEADLNIEQLGLQVESPGGFSNVSEFFVKQSATGYQLGDLIASGDHKTLVGENWVSLKDNPQAICLNKKIPVVDIFVPDGNSYIANGYVNHNTSPGGWN